MSHTDKPSITRTGHGIAHNIIYEAGDAEILQLDTVLSLCFCNGRSRDKFPSVVLDFKKVYEKQVKFTQGILHTR